VITVVIPSFNRRRLTERAVDSVLAQSFQDFEIVVVDDFSRPEEVYQPPPQAAGRVRVLRLGANGGVSIARNTGVAAARTDLIAFLDSDDVWLPHRLEEHAGLFRAQPDPENVLLYSAYFTRAAEGWRVTAAVPLQSKQTMGDYLLIADGCLHVNTWLATRTLLQRFPFEPGLSQAEDWDALLRMAAAGVRFVHSARPAAVRHVDLRPDRLTTVTDVALQTRFLERNATRLSRPARLIHEAIVRQDRLRIRTGLGRFLFKMRFFATAPDTSPGQRLWTVWAYLAGRLRNKMRSAADGARYGAQIPEAEVISERMK
jgi:glycosyltransferase involved in cell wall biosynthesis